MNPFFSNGNERVNFVGDQGVNFFSNTYNPSWRDYPNMSWGGNQNHNQTNFNQGQPNYQMPPLNTQDPTNHPPDQVFGQNQYHQPQDNKPSMETFMETMMKQQKEMMENQQRMIEKLS